MGNRMAVTKEVAESYPYNSLPMAQDGKIICCFALFPVRMYPATIANWVLGLDTIALGAACIYFLALLTKDARRGVFGLVMCLAGFAWALTLYLKWVKFLKEGRLQKWWCCYFYTRQTSAWIMLLYAIAVCKFFCFLKYLAAWLLNDISEAYENRKFAPKLTASEINRLHETYAGTYWQEIATRTVMLGVDYTLIIGSTWWLAVGCAAYTAMHKMMGDKRRMDAPEVEDSGNGVQIAEQNEG